MAQAPVEMPVFDPNHPGTLTPQRIAELRERFEADRTARLMQNAVTQTPVDDVALNREVITTTDDSFSCRLDDWQVTHQKKSGRCWMFAGTNLLRVGIMKKLKRKDFELSQNYVLFWDKFERANYFLEAILETRQQDIDDRTVAFLLDHPLDDGGQWNMFVNIVRKHGVVPKAFMPESESSSNTQRMNSVLKAKLRQGACRIRQKHADGASEADLRAEKERILEEVYRILCIHLGTPPQQFLWQWNDDDKKFHRDGVLTPQQFSEKYIDIPLDEYVCLVHDPRPTSPSGRTFTVQYLGNVVGGQRVVYLNVPIELMKQIAMQTLLDGEPVWFGCDTGKMMRRDLGLWDRRLFDYEGVYQTDFSMTKAERLLYHETAMNHAMLFTGVDVVDGRPRRWRVENSWGEENGRKGFFIMNDNWFDEHMFEIAARRDRLPEELQRALEAEPIELPPWDPMGSLARR